MPKIGESIGETLTGHTALELFSETVEAAKTRLRKGWTNGSS